MSYILQIIFGICGALIFIGAVQIISPQRAMKKSVDFILGLIFVLALLAPAFALKGVSLNLPPIEKIENQNSELMAHTADYLVRAVLDSAGIKYEKLLVSADISEDGRISISKVTLASDSPREQIIKALSELVLDENVEILNE